MLQDGTLLSTSWRENNPVHGYTRQCDGDDSATVDSEATSLFSLADNLTNNERKSNERPHCTLSQWFERRVGVLTASETRQQVTLQFTRDSYLLFFVAVLASDCTGSHRNFTLLSE